MQRCGPVEIIDDLYFIAAAESDSAVAPLSDSELHVQGEVPELFVGYQIVGAGIVPDCAVSSAPAQRAVGVERLPSGQVMTVEQGDRLAFLPRPVVFVTQHWRANANPLQIR